MTAYDVIGTGGCLGCGGGVRGHVFRTMGTVSGGGGSAGVGGVVSTVGSDSSKWTKLHEYWG